MDQFPSNEFLLNSYNFLLLLTCLVVLFHLMFVWPRNITKKSWKKVDYIWLGAASIGLISLASDVRVSVANSWVEIERSRAIGILESIDYLAKEPESSYFCMTFVRGDYSPENFDEVQNNYRMACEWRKELSAYFGSINKLDTPIIIFDDLPPVVFDDPTLNEAVVWLKDRLKEYEDQIKVLSMTEAAARKRSWESELGYYAPFLLCMALALRITKVTGEVRHEP
jgi:hypothetical protein